MVDHRARLAACPLFATLPPEAIDRLGDWFVARPVTAGEVLIEEDRGASFLLVVATGSLVVAKRVDGHPEALVTRIGPGGHAGEVDLVDDERACASVIAETDGTVLVLESQRLRRMLVTDRRLFTHVARALLVDLAHKVRQTNERVRDAIAWGLDATGEAIR
ncbi:MAG: cyclic nucleotide-binding domain-containing protein [Deltaproteobacteria bacterium]|nr:cyclic nucleotide-binding domain-containing protein [Deltaproteobacteria bacterium]